MVIVSAGTIAFLFRLDAMDERELSEACWEDRQIIRINAAGRTAIPDRVIREETWSLYVNEADGQRNLVNTAACSPVDLEALAVGWAFTRGYLRDRNDLGSITIDKKAGTVSLALRNNNKNSVAVVSEESAGDITLSPKDIYAVWETFNARCPLYQATGAAHAMAVTDGTQILMLAEDVSRRNALAKIIGKVILDDVDPRGKALLVSSRLADDMFAMIEPMGIKIVLCNGAVSAGAIRRAEAAGVTLAGCIKSGNMNVYSHAGSLSDFDKNTC
ncbi:sulfurtransferase FdhD [Spirochaetia bacterium]|nr:sulfurtransferase FdhD [Spirochaetia bacterium]